MPIISSLGALTYARDVEGRTPSWEYFSILIQNSNLSIDYTTPISLFDSTDTLYLGYKTYTPSISSPQILKINISDKGNIPIVNWHDGNFACNSTAGNSFADSYNNAPGLLLNNSPAGNLFVLDSMNLAVRSPSSQDQCCETHLSLNKSNGNGITGAYFAPYIANAVSIAGELRNRRPSSIIFDTTGNYTVLGSVNPRVTVSNVTYDNNQAYITKYDGSTGNIIINKNFGVNSNVSQSGLYSIVKNKFEIGIDTGNNYRTIINTWKSSDSKYHGIVANIDATLTTINWQKTMYNNSNVLTTMDGTMLNDDSYIMLTDKSNPNNNTIITKIDYTGNIVWAIAANNFYGQRLMSDGSNVLFGGSTSYNVGNITLSKSHIFNINTGTGVINWQRELTYTGNNNYYESNISNISVQNNLLSVTNNLVQYQKSNTSNNQQFISCLVLPTSGGIPSDGNYQLTGNINLGYTESNISFSNITLTAINSNNVIMNPISSVFFNPVTVSKITPNVTPTFSQLT